VSSVAVSPDHDMSAIENDVKVMGGLAKQLRERRRLSGCLDIHSDHLNFSLDANGLPSDCDQDPHGEAQELIEEV
jgi:protein SSD1